MFLIETNTLLYNAYYSEGFIYQASLVKYDATFSYNEVVNSYT